MTPLSRRAIRRQRLRIEGLEEAVKVVSSGRGCVLWLGPNHSVDIGSWAAATLRAHIDSIKNGERE